MKWYLVPQKTAPFLKKYFSSPPHNLVSKLSLLPNTFTESKTASYFDNNVVSKDLNFELSKTSPEKILSIFNDLNPSKKLALIVYQINF